MKDHEEAKAWKLALLSLQKQKEQQEATNLKFKIIH
jgi:hypothetical protein